MNLRQLVGLCVLVSACGGEIVDESWGDSTELFSHLRPEDRVTIAGKLEMLIADDFERHAASRLFFLVEDDGHRRSLHIPPQLAERIRDGQRATITGRLNADALLVEAVDAPSAGAPAEELAAATTLRRAVVLRVNFADKAVSCTEADVTATMYTGGQNIAGWYNENSNGLLSFDPDTDKNGVPDVFSVSIARLSTETCDQYAIAAAANSAATAIGIDLNLYQHRIYVLPKLATCGWAGLGNTSCSTSCNAWVNSCTADVYQHELGHNLGMAHASTDTNNDGVVDSEYGDYSDFMGIGGIGYRHNNAPHKIQLSWLPSGKVVSPASSNVIAPVEMSPAATSSAQAVRIPIASLPGTSYYVSYRRALGGYSTQLGSHSGLVQIHRYSQGYAKTLRVAELAAGMSWSDSAAGLTLTHRASDVAGATIDFNTVCVPQPPSVTFSSGGMSQPLGQGTLTATISNRDSACPDATFSLSTVVPSGWSSTISTSAVTLAAGAQSNVQLAVTVGSSVDGAFPISLSAVRAADSASGSTTWTVDGTAPASVMTLAGSSSQGKVQLSWSVPSDGTGSGAATYRILRDGALVSTTTVTSYVDASVLVGNTYTYAVVAIDRVGNVSAPGNAAVVTVRSKSRRK